MMRNSVPEEGTLTAVSTLLMEWQAGSEKAGEELLLHVYAELRRLAAHHMRRESPDHTLTPTALVHELYLRLFTAEPIEWRNRAHFFAVAARQFRHILVDHARMRQADKREGQRIQVTLVDAASSVQTPLHDLLALDEALDRLEELDSRASRIVEIRFFGGLTENEAAEVLGISVATVKRDWKFARTWLLGQLTMQPPPAK